MSQDHKLPQQEWLGKVNQVLFDNIREMVFQKVNVWFSFHITGADFLEKCLLKMVAIF